MTETAVGTNSDIQTAIPNGGDGILIDGHAHDNAIGGFQPSIEPQVTVSANRGYGIQVADYGPRQRHLPHLHRHQRPGHRGTRQRARRDRHRLRHVVHHRGRRVARPAGRDPLQRRTRRDDPVVEGQCHLGTRSRVGQHGNGSENHPAASGNGVFVTGVVTGTQVQNNAISGNAGDGVTLVQARKVTIGGNSSGAAARSSPAQATGS